MLLFASYLCRTYSLCRLLCISWFFNQIVLRALFDHHMITSQSLDVSHCTYSLRKRLFCLSSFFKNANGGQFSLLLFISIALNLRQFPLHNHVLWLCIRVLYLRLLSSRLRECDSNCQIIFVSYSVRPRVQFFLQLLTISPCSLVLVYGCVRFPRNVGTTPNAGR